MHEDCIVNLQIHDVLNSKGSVGAPVEVNKLYT